MTDRLSELLERAHTDLGAPALPPVAAVKRRGDTLRLRRRVAAGVAGALTVASVVTAAALLRPTGLATDLPAIRPSADPSPSRVAGCSADGLLLPEDLGPPMTWQRTAVDGDSGDGIVEVGVPTCRSRSESPVEMIPASGQMAQYRGRTTEGAAWTATERLGTLTPTIAAELAAKLKELSACGSPRLVPRWRPRSTW